MRILYSGREDREAIRRERMADMKSYNKGDRITTCVKKEEKYSGMRADQKVEC